MDSAKRAGHWLGEVVARVCPFKPLVESSSLSALTQSHIGPLSGILSHLDLPEGRFFVIRFHHSDYESNRALSVIGTLDSATETGQFSLASLAICWNCSLLIPGALASISSWMRVIRCFPSTCSIVTWASVWMRCGGKPALVRFELTDIE